jgi:hypothetical protein
MLSRIGRSLVKSSFTKHLLKRVAISSSICGKTITWLPKMRMSDDQTSNVFQKLSTQLEKEIKYEIENYVQLEDQQVCFLFCISLQKNKSNSDYFSNS